MKIFKDKTILITGHTGFKGSWLSIWLSHIGARVVGLSDGLISEPSNYDVSSAFKYVEDNRFDIRDLDKVTKLIKKIQPDFIFHLAAQSLVRAAYENPIDTMTTNAIGSANILEALKAIDKKVSVIMITSDKSYDNVEWEWGYRETDRLGGKDPYSASKGMAELAIRSYIDSFYSDNKKSNIRVSVARAGNVIGGGDWAIDRIVPDCMKAWASGGIANIRNPNATRPWQHVLEPLSGYICLAKNLYFDSAYHGEAFNFGPASLSNYSVKDLITEMSNHWNQIKWKDSSGNKLNHHEAALLKLNCDKALFHLGWHSCLNFEETVKMTVEWYKNYYESSSITMYDFSVDQIETYIQKAELSNLSWTNRS